MFVTSDELYQFCCHLQNVGRSKVEVSSCLDFNVLSTTQGHLGMKADVKLQVFVTCGTS